MEDVLQRWQSEKTAAYLANAVAAKERDPKRAKFFRKMAKAADAQADILVKEIKPKPAFTPSVRTRILSSLLGVIPPRAMRNALSAHKVRGISVYRSKAFDPETDIKKADTKKTDAKKADGKKAEPPGHPWPTSTEDIGRRHKTVDNSGTLRAGVFGVNDGLVSNTCLVMGVAGAGIGSSEILLTGVAGLLAGAFSMAAGEFISMLSQKEMFQHQIAQERDELERYPKEEAEELALIYEARGIPLDEARDLATHIVSDPEKALDVLAREELGLNPDELGSPPKAAISSFLTFSVGASVPLVPYLLGYDKEGIVIAAVLAGIALFAVGSALSLFSGRSAFLGGGRMLLVGSIAGAATYSLGALFGASVG